jgi:hypothetical protein
MDRAVSKEWVDVASALRDTVGAALTVGPTERPAQLFHFTDCDGLVGILKSRSLCASLAASLNDPSEVQYGVKRACDLISAHTFSSETLLMSRVVELLRRPFRWHVYVISFCADTGTGLHWLHYGRSGLGIAVGFDSRAVEKEPFFLFPVLYREDQQNDLLKYIVETIDRSLTESLHLINSGRERGLLADIGADLAANYIWMAAPRMKDPAFAAEKEWRLITYAPRGEGSLKVASRAGKTRFRSVAGRVVPYKKLVFSPLPVLQIILGYSTPMPADDLVACTD